MYATKFSLYATGCGKTLHIRCIVKTEFAYKSHTLQLTFVQVWGFILDIKRLLYAHAKTTEIKKLRPKGIATYMRGVSRHYADTDIQLWWCKLY